MFNANASERTGAAPGGGMAAKVIDILDLTERRTISTAEAAEALGVPLRTVQRWCEEGKLPARQVGRDYRINLRVIRERHPDLWEEMLDAREDRMLRDSVTVLGPTGSDG